MRRILKKNLQLIGKNDPAALKEFNAAFTRVECKRGEILFPIGKVCRKLYILESGSAKQFRYNEDGSEHISWFNFEGDLVTSYSSFILDKPSEEGVIALEDCQFLSLSRETCCELAEKYHAIETFFRKMLGVYYIESDKRLFFLQAMSARQKYEHIKKHNPHFLQRLSQKELSSFLGISRETLSRIISNYS